MRHLEPRQLEPSRPQPRGRRCAFWATGFLVATLGVGWLGTHFLLPSEADVVSQAEIDKRGLLLRGIAPMTLTVVSPANVDKAILSMDLAPAKQQELKRALGSAPGYTTSMPVLGPASKRPTVAAQTAPEASPLKLVELILWDTHAPDGDVVVVASGGYTREVVLAKQPLTVFVPVAPGAAISITGVHDGGGGITLGVRGASQELLMPIMSEGQTILLPVAPLSPQSK